MSHTNSLCHKASVRTPSAAIDNRGHCEVPMFVLSVLLPDVSVSYPYNAREVLRFGELKEDWYGCAIKIKLFYGLN